MEHLAKLVWALLSLFFDLGYIVDIAKYYREFGYHGFKGTIIRENVFNDASLSPTSQLAVTPQSERCCSTKTCQIIQVRARAGTRSRRFGTKPGTPRWTRSSFVPKKKNGTTDIQTNSFIKLRFIKYRENIKQDKK